MSYRKTAHFRLDSIAGVLLLVAFIVGMFFILKGIFWVLSWVAPALLLAAFIMDKSVVINYVKWLGDLVKSNPLTGILAIVLTFLGYMVVFPYLFIKALFKKKIKDVQQRYERDQQGELVDFEEIESRPKRERIELPRTEAREKPKGEYDKFFE